ncbi:hypothetical protein PJI17_32070, partial [Mycobacterium kansasii]
PSKRNAEAEKTLNQIHGLDMKEEMSGLSDAEQHRRTMLAAKYSEYLKEEEIKWHQRSRPLWFKEGDKNTQFFHSIANVRARTNHMSRV